MLALVVVVLTILSLVLAIAVYSLQIWKELERKDGKPPI